MFFKYRMSSSVLQSSWVDSYTPPVGVSVGAEKVISKVVRYGNSEATAENITSSPSVLGVATPLTVTAGQTIIIEAFCVMNLATVNAVAPTPPLITRQFSILIDDGGSVTTTVSLLSPSDGDNYIVGDQLFQVIAFHTITNTSITISLVAETSGGTLTNLTTPAKGYGFVAYIQ